MCSRRPRQSCTALPRRRAAHHRHGSARCAGDPALWRSRVVESFERDEFTLYGRFDSPTTAAARPSCSSTTPTRRPHCWSCGRAVALAGAGDPAGAARRRPAQLAHEQLIERWRVFALANTRQPVHFTCVMGAKRTPATSPTSATSRRKPDRRAHAADRRDGLGQREPCLRRPHDQELHTLFKLYPGSGHQRAVRAAARRFAGPDPRATWKMLLSNKGILPSWLELFPDHPNLLPACFAPAKLEGDWFEKPPRSREARTFA